MGEESITIERRYCGPPLSGNGGYVAGRLAEYVDAPAVAVRLRLPPPLETPLLVRVSREAEGIRATLFDASNPVAEARPSDRELMPGLVAPPAPSFEEAVAAARDFRGFHDHVFPGCFVCGTERGEGDGLRIFPGPTGEGALFAAPWIPDASLAAKKTGGSAADPIAGAPVAPEFIWAALDCPGAFSFPQPEGKVILLGEMKVALSGGVRVGERCVLASWEIEKQGRKHFTGSALYGGEGDCRGLALGVWFEVDPASIARA